MFAPRNLRIFRAVVLVFLARFAIGQQMMTKQVLKDENSQNGNKEEDNYVKPQYKFGYSVYDPFTYDMKSQWEHRDGDTVRGSYALLDADGFMRVVEYQSDKDLGFRAIVKKIPVQFGENKLPEVSQFLPFVKQQPTTPLSSGYQQPLNVPLKGSENYVENKQYSSAINRGFSPEPVKEYYSDRAGYVSKMPEARDVQPTKGYSYTQTHGYDTVATNGPKTLPANAYNTLSGNSPPTAGYNPLSANQYNNLPTPGYNPVSAKQYSTPEYNPVFAKQYNLPTPGYSPPPAKEHRSSPTYSPIAAQQHNSLPTKGYNFVVSKEQNGIRAKGHNIPPTQAYITANSKGYESPITQKYTLPLAPTKLPSRYITPTRAYNQKQDTAPNSAPFQGSAQEKNQRSAGYNSPSKNEEGYEYVNRYNSLESKEYYDLPSAVANEQSKDINYEQNDGEVYDDLPAPSKGEYTYHRNEVYNKYNRKDYEMETTSGYSMGPR